MRALRTRRVHLASAELVKDRRLVNEMWELPWRPWFPEGPGEPDLVLIKITPEHVGYVHPETGRLQVGFTNVRPVLTRSREEPAPEKILDFH